jgi:hypothetical protein
MHSDQPTPVELTPQERDTQKTESNGPMILHEAKQDEPLVKVKPSKKRKYPPTITVLDLLLMQFDPIQFIIETILPVGLTIIAGLPKTGKSLLTVMMMLAVGKGLRLFVSLGTVKSEVLLISLEDRRRTIYNRVKKMMKRFPPTDQVQISTEWEKNFEENLDSLKNFLDDHPRVRLVIIDTLAFFTGKKVRGSYFADYENVTKLRIIANERNIAILAVHHVKKTPQKDWLSGLYGSHGIPGAADSLLYLERMRGGKTANLHFTSRESEDGSINLKFNKDYLIWEEAGYEPQITPERRELWDIINNSNRPLSLKEITARSGKKLTNVQKMLKGMVDDDLLVQPKRGQYVISPDLKEDRVVVDFPSVDEINYQSTSDFRNMWQ